MFENLMASKEDKPADRVDTADPLVSDATATIQNHKRRGRPPKDATATVSEKPVRKTSKALELETQARMMEQLDKLFQPKAFRALVAAPANVLLAKTGSNAWKLPEDEVEAMAESGCITARAFLEIDPKWAALVIFALSTASIYSAHAAMYYHDERAKKPA
ncbi:MAG: hypothetical protein ACYCVY_13270 [Acidiferrobacteraceae bacterium]